MSEGHPGAGRRGGDRGDWGDRDRDIPPDPEPQSGSSVFDRYPPDPPSQAPPHHPGSPPYGGQVHVPAPPSPEPPTPTQPHPQSSYPWPDDAAGTPPPRPPDRARPPRQPRDRRPRRDDRPARREGGGLPVGAGALVGTAGAVCFLLALVVLPWFRAGGEEADLSDLRTAFQVPETRAEDLPGASPGEPSPEPGDAQGTPPAPEDVGAAVEDEIRDRATEAAADAIDAGRARYLELYVERLWVIAAIAVPLAVLFSTILAPRSFALSLLLGFRPLAGFVTLLVGAAHGAALWVVFTGQGAPDPAFGVWLGLGGLAAVFAGCIIGPKSR